MSSEIKVPEWRQFEWLISKIFHDNHTSLKTKVINDTSVIGEYSERSRQIDILVESVDCKTMIECKHYSRPVDLKAVEAFLSMFEDVNADFGILISSSGFTKSGSKRILQFPDKIKLEHIDWNSAYENSFQEEEYGRMKDVCSNCIEKYESGKEVPGLLCWDHGHYLEIQGKAFMYSIAECLKCNSIAVDCDSCGKVTLPNSDETCCANRDVFLKCYNET